jgi:Ubiquitin-activating enzyme E1 four-helix bundle
MKFKSYREVYENAPAKDIPLDGNLAVADFEKIANLHLSNLAFDTLNLFRKESENALPRAWHLQDCMKFNALAKQLRNSSRYEGHTDIKPVAEWYATDAMPEVRYLSLFALTCQGVFNPLCAFQGGVVA